jgi:hypothetical protein
LEEGSDKREDGNLHRATPLSVADIFLDTVYGDHVHQNPGSHSNGSVPDDAKWQDYWGQLVVFPSQTYDAPKGAVGTRFIEELAELILGILDRRINAEQFIVFQMVMLQRSREVTGASAIRRRITRWLDAWKERKFDMLVQSTVRDMESYLSSKQRGVTKEQRAKIFHGKMLQGNVRGAVRYLTDREQGGILLPDDIDEKTGDSVKEVLESKHPHARMPDVTSLPTYINTPDFVELDVTEEAVKKVARRLSGSAGGIRTNKVCIRCRVCRRM